MNSYDKQAIDFLDKYKINFNFKYLGATNKWGGTRPHYEIELKRTKKTGENLVWTFKFWGSIDDYKNGITRPTLYDVLSAISGDEIYTTEDEIISSFGYDLSGIDVEGLIHAAKEMHKFFSLAALRDLREIN